MAVILIAEGNAAVARKMARTFRRIGHIPVVAQNAWTVLEEALDIPDIHLILIDQWLPDLPGTEVVDRLRSQPETAHIPVVLFAGHPEAATRHPIPIPPHCPPPRWILVQRLIETGSERLAFHVYQRLCADRSQASCATARDVPTWAEIARWARAEGVISEEQAGLIAPAASARGGHEPSSVA